MSLDIGSTYLCWIFSIRINELKLFIGRLVQRAIIVLLYGNDCIIQLLPWSNLQLMLNASQIAVLMLHVFQYLIIEILDKSTVAPITRYVCAAR